MRKVLYTEKKRMQNASLSDFSSGAENNKKAAVKTAALGVCSLEKARSLKRQQPGLLWSPG